MAIELKFKHFIFLQAMDVLTTWYAIKYLNLSEANPFTNQMMAEYGLILGLIAVKLIGVILIYPAIKVIASGIKIIIPDINKHNLQKIGINTICFVIFVVIANNIYQIAYTTFIS